jgi:hypothetical protein
MRQNLMNCYLEIAERVRDGWQVIWGVDGPVQEYTPDS